MSVEQETAVDVVEMTRILNVSTDTVYRRARTGEIPAHKVGVLWRFWPSEVRTHLAQPRDPWAQSTRSHARWRVDEFGRRYRRT